MKYLVERRFNNNYLRMKQTIIILCVMALAACTDHRTPLEIDTWPSLLVFNNQGVNSTGEHELRWIAGREKMYYNIEVQVLGAVVDYPRYFRLRQTNDGGDDVLVVGKIGETWEDIEYELPANETSFLISIPFLWDDKRMSTAIENRDKTVAVYLTVKSYIGEDIHGTNVKFVILNPR